MSTRPDMLPEDIATELQSLQDQVAPFDSQLFKQLVEEGLGASVEDVFAEFEPEPLASASLAQVHGAVLKTGEKVVVKVLRPNIAQQVKRDLRLMRARISLRSRFTCCAIFGRNTFTTTFSPVFNTAPCT